MEITGFIFIQLETYLLRECKNKIGEKLFLVERRDFLIIWISGIIFEITKSIMICFLLLSLHIP